MAIDAGKAFVEVKDNSLALKSIESSIKIYSEISDENGTILSVRESSAVSACSPPVNSLVGLLIDSTPPCLKIPCQKVR